ncbi:MAG: DUF1080 domain-containing protein [Gemmataceae bacterium]|nr:DUF1080 domain-containing protein [Gemmataceae bacterium]
MRFPVISLALVALTVAGAAGLPAGDRREPVRPTAVGKLFNGKDLSGLYTWLRKTGREDPKKVFAVRDGVIHVSGEDNGYLATDREYRDYRVSVEYRWGKKTFGSKYVRNSGLLLHATGPDGGAGGTWMASIECQLAQGCIGDLIAIRGKGADGKVIPVQFTSDVAIGPDKRPRWKEGGERRVFTKGQLWWNRHEPFFKELIDTRGKDDVESKLGEWTRVECICQGKTITVLVNGHTVNRCYDVFPAAGKILLQSEGFEMDFRNFELRPLR